MAKNEKKPGRDRELKGVAGTMQDLIGNSVDIKMPGGETIIVPSDKSGNRVANMILAAQIRAMIQKNLKKYDDQDMLATPKDLKDLAEAAKSLHQFSGDVYKEEDSGQISAKPKKIEDAKVESEVNFDDAIDATQEAKK